MPRDLGREPRNLTPHLIPPQLIIPQNQYENWTRFCGKIVSPACHKLLHIADLPKIARLGAKRRQAMDPSNAFPWWQVRRLHALNIHVLGPKIPTLHFDAVATVARDVKPVVGRHLMERAFRTQVVMDLTYHRV